MTDEVGNETPRIGLALSGGGCRAIAFHLGCLRALNDLGILSRVEVLSTVSGGSVIGALYAAKDIPFEEFELKVRTLLERGLLRPAIRTALTTSEGFKAAFCWSLVGPLSMVLSIVVGIINVLSLLAPPTERRKWRLEYVHPPVRRFASRTTILMRAIDDELFKRQCLRELPTGKPRLIINAAELRTGSAFYFGSEESGSWRYGKIAQKEISLAHAVTASAAYPFFLPALDEELAFDKRDGTRGVDRVTLTDGGVYDNLGLAPLWPDRDSSISFNVEKLDIIICCRAGYGLRKDPPTQFLLARLKSSFASIHDRAQNASMKRLFDLKNSGKLKDFLLPYLGQNDDRLRFKPDDLVTREDIYGYPTDFSAMERQWIDKLSKRGEQLTRALIAEHTPHLFRESRR